jgi:hypothetical protein
MVWFCDTIQLLIVGVNWWARSENPSLELPFSILPRKCMAKSYAEKLKSISEDCDVYMVMWATRIETSLSARARCA